MTFQAYLDTVKAKTGKTPADFAKLAAQQKLAQKELLPWLKSEFGLGHGHAMAIYATLTKGDSFHAPKATKLDALFSGSKTGWRGPAEKLIAQVEKFGDDVAVQPNETYINLLRGKKKFGIIQPSSGDRLDIGIKLKGVDADGRFELAGAWNAMVTHRVRIGDAKEVNAEVVRWLKKAYAAAGT